MSGCSEIDAGRFQRASPAAGQICWDFFVGLGLGQEAFGSYGSISPLDSIYVFCFSFN